MDIKVKNNDLLRVTDANILFLFKDGSHHQCLSLMNADIRYRTNLISTASKTVDIGPIIDASLHFSAHRKVS